jgi:hypothetical protein
MKKRSRYRPKGVIPDPLSFTVTSSKLLKEEYPQYVLELKIKNHAAMLALTQGKATLSDLNDLIQMYNAMDGFRVTGITGIEHELNEAGKSLSAIAARDKKLATGPEIRAINTLLDYHDELFEHITVRQLHMAVNSVVKAIKSGNVRRIAK